MGKVLRITRHPADAAREAFLRKVFGDDVQIVTEDLPYGEDPVAAVAERIRQLEDVVAVEAIAPFPLLMKLVDGGRRLGVPLIRSEFARDGSGRAVVVGKDANGRDLLAFDRYVELVRISFETRELLA